MGKRKVKNKTLTKIDPSVFKPKPQATSLHDAGNGIRVTTTVKLTGPSQPPEALLDSAAFHVDIPNTTDDVIGEDVSRGYYVARVCSFSPIPLLETNYALGQPTPTMEVTTGSVP